MDAITGQPMPGEPSITASSLPAGRFHKSVDLTSETSLPELPRPIVSSAVANTLSPR